MKGTKNTECCGSEKECCSSSSQHGHGFLSTIVILLLLINSAGITALYLGKGKSSTEGTDKILQTMTADKYNEQGGKEMYELFLKYLQLSASSRKSQLEDAIKQLGGTPPSEANAGPKVLSDDQKSTIFKNAFVVGNKNAKFTMVEYSDVECPYCIIQQKNGVIAAMEKKYGNDVNSIYKTLNLAGHKGSDQKSLAALCVAQTSGAEKYDKFIRTMMSESDERGTPYATDKIETLAKNVGANMSDYKKCIDSKATDALYKAYTSEAMTIGVRGTPTTMIINNQTGEYDMVSGAAPAASFEAIFTKLTK